MYLTHYGRVDEVQRLAARMIEGIDTLVEFAERYKDDIIRRQKIETAITDWLLEGLVNHGVSLAQVRCLELLQTDIVLNTQGIEFWLDHRDR
jgi:hypothetical protein